MSYLFNSFVKYYNQKKIKTKSKKVKKVKKRKFKK
jgi:hypothetical protein